MKKIYLKGYLYKNLGDDLFFKIISERYPNTSFYAISNFRYQLSNNIKVYKRNKFINKMLKITTKNEKNQERQIIDKCDVNVIIGGSIFIEGKSNFDNYIFKKDYYILGANFGPYTNSNFYNKYFNIFKNAKDVCFRDKKSADLFNELKNVRYTSDIVFSLNYNKVTKEKNNVIISVIDIAKKENDETLKENYHELIIELIKYFYYHDYTVTLMSFCKYEGDEQAIDDILNSIAENNIKNNINKYKYSGNIDEALSVINSSKIVVGSRFHANIIGLTLGKKILPIAYSDKLINALNDMGYNGEIFDIRNNKKTNIEKYIESNLNCKNNISNFRKQSTNQFKLLDKLLEGNDENEKQ